MSSLSLHKTLTRIQHTCRKYSSKPFVKEMQDLQTDTSPTQHELSPAASKLRQKIQSSPWVQQAISGTRKCLFSGLYMPQDMLLRVKCKTDPKHNQRHILAIDELERYSEDFGKSGYLPLTARGLYAAMTDRTNQKAITGIGWVRPDIVEHTARVLRLRTITAMHRVHLEFLAHSAKPPAPLDIPNKGTTFGLPESRLDVIRKEITGRILRQDGQWAGTSVYINLPQPSADGMEWELPEDMVLPPGGLQCILELPAVDTKNDSKSIFHFTSLTSEANAKKSWQQLTTESQIDPIGGDVLEYGMSWKAFVMTGRPEPHKEPVIGLSALERLYYCLPTITSSELVIPELKQKGSKKVKKGTKTDNSTKPSIDSVVDKQKSHHVRTPGTISFSYSLQKAGKPFANSLVAYGREQRKQIPVYHLSSLYGDSACISVLPWLLGQNVTEVDQAEGSKLKRYVGVVAIPCTAELATQFHRLAEFVG